MVSSVTYSVKLKYVFIIYFDLYINNFNIFKKNKKRFNNNSPELFAIILIKRNMY